MEKPFVFSDHIKPVNLSQRITEIEKSLQSTFGNVPGRKQLLQARRKKLEDFQEKCQKSYQIMSDNFEGIRTQNLCKATHIKDGWYYRLKVAGDGFIPFLVNGTIQHGYNRERGVKTTTIPIWEGDEEEKLVIFDHPQKEISPVGKIQVRYKFEHRISLGDDDDWNSKFTKDIFNTGNILIDNSRTYFGKPDCLVLRTGDALWDDFIHLFLGAHPDYMGFESMKNNWDLSGQIYVNDELYYSGVMGSTGTFPFFIRKKKDPDGPRKERPIPKNPALEPIRT